MGNISSNGTDSTEESHNALKITIDLKKQVRP